MDLRAFIERIESRGQLVKVARPVAVEYEIAAVTRALGGRPVLFERVEGRQMSVISNLCATRELVCLGIGAERKDLHRRLAAAVAEPRKPEIVPAEGYRETEPDLSHLPILKYYPDDGGPYIASGIVVAKDPEYGLNASYHRSLVRSDRELVLRVVERHLHEYMRRGVDRFAFCIGNSMPVMVAAAISIELGKSEFDVANALGETRLVELEGHVVPQSEIVLLCRFTGEQAEEGPFLDLTETYDIVRKQPVAVVERMFTRPDPVFHALLPGGLEHKVLMGMPREPTIFREVSAVCECLDVCVTPGGCSWLHAAVKIRKRDPQDAKRAIKAAFQGHASLKHVFVVDEDIDIEDPSALEWAMATRFQADKDLVVKPHEKGSSLDPSSDQSTRETAKAGFDLTIPDPGRKKMFARVEPPLRIELDDYVD